MSEDTVMWQGKSLENCSKEELIEAVKWLGEQYQKYMAAGPVIAAGKVAMLRRTN